MRRCFILLLLSLPSLVSAQSLRYFVQATAAGAGNGKNWQNAFTDLHDALTLAAAGDEVWVAQGTYTPSDTTDRRRYFRLPSGVRLYGGFAGTETAVEQRNTAQNPTVLSGDIGIRGDKSDNAYNILYAFQPDSNTLIDGFTFTDGNANATGITNFQPGAYGAALLVNGQDGVARLRVRACRFERNSARASGGAVCVNGSGNSDAAPLFESCVFLNNTSGGAGGTVYRTGGSNNDRPADFLKCRFENNTAVKGGAIYYRDSEKTDTLDIRDCFFQANITSLIQTSSSVAFGAPRKDNYSSLHIRNSTFNEIQPSSSISSTIALDVFFDQGNFYSLMDSCVLTNIPRGGVLFEVDGYQKCTITRTSIRSNPLFLFNIADVAGGVPRRIRFDVSDVKIHNNGHVRIGSDLLTNALIYSNESGIVGAATMVNCLITHNQFPSGAWVMTNCAFIKNNLQYDSDLKGYTVKNCLFYDNKEVTTGTGTMIFTNPFNCFDNCLFYVVNPFTPLTSVEGCSANPGNLYNVDPMFRDTAAGDYRLRPCSPLIDAGSNAALRTASVTTDLNGTPRIQGTAVDIGAYESSDQLTDIQASVQAACKDSTTGGIRLRINDGCPPYTFRWTNDTRSGTRLTYIEPGNYRLSITDKKGRTGSMSITIPASVPRPAFQGDSAVCAGAADATLSASVTGSAAPPFSYQWADGSAQATRTGLPPGLYTLVVRDTLGCRDTATVAVRTVAAPQLDTIVLHAVLPDADNGIIAVQPSGNDGPYTFHWSNGASTERIEGLSRGLYALTLTDKEGCNYFSQYRIDAVVSAGQPPETASGTVAPNPAAMAIALQFAAADHWTLWDIRGRPVLQVAAAPTPPCRSQSPTCLRGCTGTRSPKRESRGDGGSG